MSDIVEILRDPNTYSYAYFVQAADEIERLRARVAELEVQLEQSRRLGKLGGYPCTPEHTWAEWLEDRHKRVAELEAAQEWRTIESAPKNGSRMLLALCDRGHVYWCVTGVWSERFQNWNDGMEPAGLADPTHWLPLPAPPKVAT